MFFFMMNGEFQTVLNIHRENTGILSDSWNNYNTSDHSTVDVRQEYCAGDHRKVRDGQHLPMKWKWITMLSYNELLVSKNCRMDMILDIFLIHDTEKRILNSAIPFTVFYPTKFMFVYDWWILTICQIILGSFMLKGYGITFIVRFYLYFCAIVSYEIFCAWSYRIRIFLSESIRPMYET